MQKRLTIKDIARELNIHHSTVSRALRNDSRVKEGTRKTIISFARAHGYQVNMSALQLRGNVKNSIAVIVPNIHHMFFSNMVSLIANYAKNDGFIISIFQSNESFEEELEIINTIIRNNVDGVIASVSLQTKNGHHFEELKKYKIPLVFFDRVCTSVNVPTVTVNSYEIVAKAVGMLAKKGHSRIAHLSGAGGLNVFRERQLGYLQGLEQNNLGYKKIVTIEKEFTPEDGRIAVRQLLNEDIKPNGLIVDSHNLNLGVILELRAQNWHIPKDIGIISFGDNPSIDVIQPGITTIVQPEEEIARISFELLQEQLKNGMDVKVRSVVIPSRIVERESC